ncbi:MAG TPA: primosomal protein N', partial [Pyrinomonadaceae bacterium]|nr:primosomal protein N' [Pyrinomonadaceae bacterium]
FELKDILSAIDTVPIISQELLGLAKWAADYYLGSLGELLKAALPAGMDLSEARMVAPLLPQSKAAHLRAATQRKIFLHLTAHGEKTFRSLEREFGKAAARRAIAALEKLGFVKITDVVKKPKAAPKIRKYIRLIKNEEAEPLNDKQKLLTEILRQNDCKMLLSEAVAAVGTASVIRSLIRKGIVEEFSDELFRDPLRGDEIAPEEFELNSSQKEVLGKIQLSLDQNKFKPFLLHGVTGSGKTEIYIRAIKHILSQGKSAVLLVPEIALTPLFARRLRGHFGSQVAILHSSLGEGERFDEWRRLKSAEAKIAIGTRSAIFAPVEKPSLIIVDEEHDSSYYQHEPPFYNARDLALVRGRDCGATVVLGSATPSLETYYNAQKGKYELLELPQRVEGRPLPQAEIIDMREEFRKSGRSMLISPVLRNAIKETISRGNQAILLLNRRGFSAFVLCRMCGNTIKCKNCDVSLTYHKRENKLICHYCNYSIKTPDKCPVCLSEYLYFIGEGTEQLEDRLDKIFPDARIGRLDRDVVRRRGEVDQILKKFDQGELDILAGTQMLAKGHDFHKVTLVGVVSVDNILGLPDFRAAERTFQLLAQVAGRAGRGKLKGQVFIQSYLPDHYVLEFARRQDYKGFYEAELNFRKSMYFPPFCYLASILVTHKNQESAQKFAQRFRQALDRANAQKKCRISGPASAAIARLKGIYRFQILVRSPHRSLLHDVISEAEKLADSAGVDRSNLRIEVDPIELT